MAQPDYTKLLKDNKITGLANPERFYVNNRFDAGKARGAYITENLRLDNSVIKGDLGRANFASQIRDKGLDYTAFRLDATGVKQADQLVPYKNLGLTDVARFIGKPAEAEAALISEVYKLDPAKYAKTEKVLTGTRRNPQTGKIENVYANTVKYSYETARQDYQRELPTLTYTDSTDLGQALTNFQRAINSVGEVGIENVNQADLKTLRKLANEVFDQGGGISDPTVEDAVQAVRGSLDFLSSIATTRATLKSNQDRLAFLNTGAGVKERYTNYKADLGGKIAQGNSELAGKIAQANNNIFDLSGILGRVNPLAALPSIGTATSATPSSGGGAATAAGSAGTGAATGSGASGGTTADGLALLTPSQLGTEARAITNPSPTTTINTLISSGTLNSQISDDEITKIVNETSAFKVQSAIDTMNANISSINTQIASVDGALAKISNTHPQYASLVAKKDDLTKDLANATKILDYNTSIKSGSVKSPYVVDVEQIRKQLQLPEQNVVAQIDEIDPAMMRNARLLQDQYSSMLSSPLGPTQDDRTEMMRGYIEDEALNQLRMGSSLDEATRRDVQQAARAAQTARGNIYGAAPAAEEIMQTGLMGEQRKLQRYGAAAAFLGSGQSRTDQAARNTGLRQALDLNRLGAANAFLAEGANPYNIARDRVAQQDARAINYINANAAAAGGFANTAQQAEPFRYVNPNAGINLAQNAANIFGNYLDYGSRTYAAQVGAQAQVASANSIPNYISAFSGLVPSFSF